MLISLNWLQEFLSIDLSVEDLAEKLSLAGLEVESIKKMGEGLDHVFTATVLEKKPHPNADKLSLCQVRCGQEILAIVCGAKNFKEGDRVALARIGAKLPNGLKIKESKIRGELSQGMLCSMAELGLAENSEGIWVLPPSIVEAKALTEALPLKDTILELNVTPNRGDCLSVLGVAREVGALLGQSLPLNPASIVTTNSQAAYEVQNLAPKACGRYLCRVLKGVQIKASPLKMQMQLKASGIRPINNVVDATSWLMLKTGQPLHAFDLAKVEGAKVLVRFAQRGEKLKFLDGVERELSEKDLVIADKNKALALAGVLGGEDSGVTDHSADLLLEAAYFTPAGVRATAKRFGLQTDSSYRFERGVDPSVTEEVLEELTHLLVEEAEAQEVGPMVITGAKPEPLQIDLQDSEIKRLLGQEIPLKEMETSLKVLGLDFVSSRPGLWRFTIPSFRSDLTRPIDLIEEIARLYGYDRLGEAFDSLNLKELSSLNPPQTPLKKYLYQLLVAQGYTECLHYSFTSPKLLADYGIEPDPQLFLANPLSENYSVMRSALFPDLLKSLIQNHNRGQERLKLFELRTVYGQVEKPHLCLAWMGSKSLSHFKNKEEPADLLDLKGTLEELLRGWMGGFLEFVELKKPFLHPKRQAKILWKEHPGANPQEVGWMGELHPHWVKEHHLTCPVSFAEIDLAFLDKHCKSKSLFKPLSPYPQVSRDLNLVVAENISQGTLAELFAKEGGRLLNSWELKDLYRGAPLKEGQKALTYHLVYASPERSLTDEEVNEARESLLKSLQEACGASLRE